MRRALLLLLCALPGAAFGLDAPDLPPAALVERALAAQPAVMAARALVAAEESERARLEAGPHETSVRLGMQRRRADAEGRSYGEWDVALERGLRSPAKARLDAALGEAGVSQARRAVAEATHASARELLELWFARLREDAQARQWDGQVALLARSLDVVERRVRAGDAPRMEAELARAAHQQAQVALTQARARLDAAATTLALRFPELAGTAPAEAADPPPLEADLEHWRGRVLKRNPELALARGEVDRARVLLARSEAERRPDPTVAIRYGAERAGGEQIVGVSLAIPLPGQARGAAAGSARARAQAAAAQEAAALRRVDVEVAQALAGARSSREASLRLSEVAGLVERNRELLQRAYTLGETGISEVLQASRQALEARLAAALARTDAAQARYRLLLEAHVLWSAQGE